jgi:hypothetical protein
MREQSVEKLAEDEVTVITKSEPPTKAASTKPDVNKIDQTEESSKIWYILSTIFWTPPWCRWNPDNPPTFSIWHNVLFGFAGAFTVANL